MENKSRRSGLAKTKSIKYMNKTLDELKTKIRHKEIELEYEENNHRPNHKYLKSLNQELDSLYQALDHAESNFDLANESEVNETQ